MMEFLKILKGSPESKMVTKAIENAQKRIEAQNFQIRKRLLEYDNVANIQRQAVYSMRRDLLEGKDLEEYLKKWTEDLLNQKIAELLPEEEPELWDLKPLQDYLRELTGRDIEIPKVRDKEELLEVLVWEVLKILEEKKGSGEKPSLGKFSKPLPFLTWTIYGGNTFTSLTDSERVYT